MLINGILTHIKKNEVDHPKGAVIIIHGIAEHSGRYDEITEKLNQTRLNVIRYDLRGHGQTQGKRGALKSFHQFVDDLHEIVKLEKQKHDRIFLIGHSMGGLIANLYAVKYGDITGVVSSAAPTYFIKDVMPFRVIGYRWLGFLKKKTNFADDQLSRIKEVEEAYIDDPLNLKHFHYSLAGEMFVGAVRYLNKQIDQYQTPVLIVHGGNDKIVPQSFSKRFFDLIPVEDKTLIVYPENYHEIFNDLDREVVFNDVTQWLSKRVSA